MLGHEETVKPFRAVPAAIFIFDCSRFLFLIALLSVFLRTRPGIVNLPMMMYAAPNALFPLMAFFLLTRLNNFGAYIPLYIVGKALCVLCALVWLLASLGQVQVFFAPKMVWLVFLGAADLGTIMGTAFSLPLETVPAESVEVPVMPAGSEDTADLSKIDQGGE